MRRELESHKPNTATNQLSIHATDDPGAGGANHRYFISGYDCTTNPSGDPRALHDTPIVFQNGPLKEAGPNGVTNEALLAIVEDRLVAFQAGKFACAENADALAGIRYAINQLGKRTARRVEAGIEGTHQEDPPKSDDLLTDEELAAHKLKQSQRADSTGLGDRFKEGQPEDDGPTEAEIAAMEDEAKRATFIDKEQSTKDDPNAKPKVQQEVSNTWA